MNENDFVIRLTLMDDETNVDHEQLKGIVKNAVSWTGWKVLQSGEFDSMAESMNREKEFVKIAVTEVPYIHSYPCPMCDSVEYMKKWGTDKNPAIGDDGKLDLKATVLTDKLMSVSFNGELAQSEKDHWGPEVEKILEKEKDRPLVSFGVDPKEVTRLMKEAMVNSLHDPFYYNHFPDDKDQTNSVFLGDDKKYQPALENIYRGLGIPENYQERGHRMPFIYCPDLPEDSITNRSEDSLGGIAKIVTHDRTCECKCYGWEEIERKLAAEQRKKLKDVYFSQEAMEELKNWRMEESEDRMKLSWSKVEEPSDKVPDLTPPIPQCCKKEGMEKLKEINEGKGFCSKPPDYALIWGPEIEFKTLRPDDGCDSDYVDKEHWNNVSQPKE